MCTAFLMRRNGRRAVHDQECRGLLVASHIVPWRLSSGKEKTDRHNGLLLSASLDQAKRAVGTSPVRGKEDTFATGLTVWPAAGARSTAGVDVPRAAA